jgi:serine phosphatase RsbU (regulator of sigma subunit)
MGIEVADEGLGPADQVPDVFSLLPATVWRPAWDDSPALVAVTYGPEHALLYQNPASCRVFGARPLGVPMRVAFPEMREGANEPLDRALTTGSTVTTPAHPVSVRDLRGDEVVLSYVVTPIGDPPGYLVITAMDVSAQVRAETRAAQTTLVADLTDRMTAATDAGSALAALTDCLVPAMGDVAAVYVVPEGQPPDVVPLPPEVITVAESLAALGPPPPPGERRGPSPWQDVLRAGRPVIIGIDESTLPTLASGPQSEAWLVAAKANSLVLLPLAVAGSLTGVLLLLAVGDRPPYRHEDLPFLEDVAARAGAAIAQVRTARRQRDAASELQRALLPAAPARVPGLTAAARYVAGAPDLQVGGDWWDLHDLGDGLVGLGIGDVSGRGIPAAAVMGQARAVMRAGGHAHLPPVEVLRLMDGQLVEMLAMPDASLGELSRAVRAAPVRFATACYAVLDLRGLRLRVANAGHLPILLRTAAGDVRRIQAPPGAPLGVGVGGFVEITEDVGPDDTLVLFTDGLVESRVLDIDDGLAMLADAFAACGVHDDLDVVADALLDAMERRQGHGEDDLALVVVRIDRVA